ncbi:hypothetical protein D3C81_2154710 [compost metagenome]
MVGSNNIQLLSCGHIVHVMHQETGGAKGGFAVQHALGIDGFRTVAADQCIRLGR